MITLINMSLENKINESIKDSMKSRDTLRLESLRAVKAGILLEKTKTGSKDQVDEAVILKILQKMVKQRNESAKIFSEQKREELANIEISQAKIISEFLPDQLSEIELSVIIDSVIKDLNAESMKDMGKVISNVNQKTSGKAEGKVIAEMVKNKLISYNLNSFQCQFYVTPSFELSFNLNSSSLIISSILLQREYTSLNDVYNGVKAILIIFSGL